jgi:acyl-CoA thioesterase
MPVGEEHTNGLGMVHGGALFSLADLAFAAASNSKGRIAVAINATISYLQAPQTDRLTAVAEEVSSGRKLATYSVTVSDGSDRICAVFQGTAYLKKGDPHAE